MNVSTNNGRDTQGSQFLKRKADFDATLPNVIAAVLAAKLQGVRDVKGRIVYEEQVLRVSTLVLFDQSTLELPNITNYPFTVIAAEEIVIDNPMVRAIITRSTNTDQAYAKAVLGEDGLEGNFGKDGVGRHGNGHGNDGQNGGEGGRGGTGGTGNIPPLFIFTNVVRLGTGTIPNHECVEVYVEGLVGGDGGTGGKGGNGGSGFDGDNAHGDALNCQRPGGNGGDGGYGGMPGRGGDAGVGGNGGSVYFYAPAGADGMFKFFAVQQEGAMAGLPGYQGPPGIGGIGGPRGHGKGQCHGGQPGADRTNSSIPRPDNGRGNSALPGTRGDQEIFVRDNSDIF